MESLKLNTHLSRLEISRLLNWSKMLIKLENVTEDVLYVLALAAAQGSINLSGRGISLINGPKLTLLVNLTISIGIILDAHPNVEIYAHALTGS
jgi:hypothetical protein